MTVLSGLIARSPRHNKYVTLQVGSLDRLYLNVYQPQLQQQWH